MPRQPVDDVFSSSPAHPSHHNKRNPYAEAQRNFNRKRSAAQAALPSPPTTQIKRKHYAAPVLSDTEDDDYDDDTQKTPTKANIRSKRLAGESPDTTTPKGRSTKAENMHPNDASPALSILATQESVSRSPSPSPSPYRRSTRRTRASTRGPILDSPNNPFLSDSPRYPKRDATPLQDRGSITYVFRGIKVPIVNHLKRNPGEPDTSRLSPSNSDYSPSAAFVPKLLFPSTSTSPVPKRKNRVTNQQHPGSPTRQQKTSSSNPNLQPVARKLFASELDAPTQTHEEKKPISWADTSTSSSTSLPEGHGALNVKAKAMKEGMKKGVMSTRMVIAHAHGPIRPNERPGMQREDTFEFVNAATKSVPKSLHSVEADQDGDSPAAPTLASGPRRSKRVAHSNSAASAAP